MPSASCSTPRTTGACGSCSMACSTTPGAGSGPSITSWKRGRHRRIGAGSGLTKRRSMRAGRLLAYPPPGSRTDGARVRGLVGSPCAAETQHERSGGSRLPVRRRRALAPVRHRRLAAGRPDGDQGRGLLAGVPIALSGDPARRLPRRRDLGRRAGMAARRPIRRADELPPGTGDPGVRGWFEAGHGGRAVAPPVQGPPPAARRAGVRRPSRRAGDRLRPGRRLGPTEPARLARCARGCERS